MMDVSAKVGLSDAQTSELLRLQDHYQFSLLLNLHAPPAWLGHNLSGYLGLLAIGAACENQGYKRIAERSAKLRQASMRAFASCLHRRPAADDLLQELSRVAVVPPFLVEAIRRDVERLINPPARQTATPSLSLRS